MSPFRKKQTTDPDAVLRKVPDDMPKDGLFAQPIVVTGITVPEPEPQQEGTTRVTFRATVKDAEGKRCPDLYVEAVVTGPEREAAGATTTDLMGQARFRMTGGPGTYRIAIDDVAAGALTLDRDASVLTAEIEVA